MAINTLMIPSVSEAFSDFSLLNYLVQIRPLLYAVIGVVIYSLFVFKFYRFFAKRDILKLELHRHASSLSGALKNFFHVIFYIIENIILIPILVFVWFAVLAILLLMISKTHTPQTVIVTAISLSLIHI